MGEEKARQLIVESRASKKEERGYLERLAKAMFATPPATAPAPRQSTAQAPARVETEVKETEQILAAAKLRKLESEHLAKISIYTRKISHLRGDREKLKSAIETLRGLNLPVPEEYGLKQHHMSEEEEVLEAEVEKEKMLLNYLQSRVLILIE